MNNNQEVSESTALLETQQRLDYFPFPLNSNFNYETGNFIKEITNSKVTEEEAK
jgi:hypothetical protein